jgi:23S rRNA (guanosine2251-2'-O)-methyltransferase
MAPPQSLGEGEELVAGRRPVEEAFVARRPARRLLVVPQRRAALEKLVLHATNLRIPIVEVEGGSLTALAGFDGHQGIALVVEPRRYAGLDDILARAATRGEPPFVLVLDSLEDPHNVGSLLRSAEAAGVHGVIFPTHRQAPLSPSAVKASAGAVEHLLLCPVDDLAGALSDLHVRGVRIAGAEGDAPMTARESDLRGPLAIVVGSEGQGLGPAVRRRCDMFMRIPMRGAVGSLNAAVAGSILLFEAVAQRDIESAAGDEAATVESPSPARPRRATKATTAAAAEPSPAKSPAKPRSDRAAKAGAAVDSPASAESPPKPKSKRAEKAGAAVDPTAPAEPPAKAKPKRATKPTATAAPAAPAKPKPRRATKPTPEVAPATPAELPAKAKPKRATKTTAVAAPAAPAKPKRATRATPAATDTSTAPDDGDGDLLPD